jgi:predicted dehydrogenase
VASAEVSGVRVGVVGVGGHATNAILPNLAPAGLTVAAVCSRHLDRARAAAAAFGAVRAYDNPAAMLDQEDVDGVVVVVPPDQYGPLVRLCLERGLPVFVDKPGAGSAQEADDLAAHARDAGVPVMVGYMKRFAPAYRQARALMSTVDFGPPSMGSFTWAMGPMAGRMDMREWLYENPVHHLDLARFLFGELHDLRVHVGANTPEHTVAVVARSDAGAVVNLRLCTTGSWAQRNESVEVFGLGHSLAVDNVDTCTYRPPSPPEQVWRPNYTVPESRNASSTTMGFGPELRHFADVVRGQATCESTMSSAAATFRLAQQVAGLTEGR